MWYFSYLQNYRKKQSIWDLILHRNSESQPNIVNKTQLKKNTVCRAHKQSFEILADVKTDFYRILIYLT